MKVLIKSAKVIAPSSEFHEKVCDLLIEDGIIRQIGSSLDAVADQVIERKNLHVSPGWFDARVNFRDPGLEYKEDVLSGLQVAEYGGITGVATSPDTHPRISNKTQVDYLINKASGSAVDVFPFGGLTDQLEGNVLSEMYDMQQAGAIAFTDAEKPVSAGIMYRALLYVRNFDGIVISFPHDPSVFGKGMVNEGTASILTGLKSIPSLAEYLVVQRDLSILEYTGSRLHFTGISTRESVEMIRQAKAKGLAVTADCYIHNLIYTEEKVLGFDSDFKLMPPLRTEQDRQALISGLKDGTIDFVCSDHKPEDIENKELEFDHAAFGSLGSQILFSLINRLPELTLDEKIRFISSGPRSAFNLDVPEIKEGAEANLTLFDPDQKWIFSKTQNASKSANSPELGNEMSGAPVGIFNKGILSITELQ